MIQKISSFNQLTESVLSEMPYGTQGQELPIADFKQKLNDLAQTGTSFVSFTSVTIPSQPKRGNPHYPIMKVSQVNATVGFDYENSVNRQRGRENAPQDFKADRPVWGQAEDSVVFTHKGKYYLRCKPESAAPPQFFVTQDDGQIVKVSKDQIDQYLRKPPPSSRQQTAVEVPVRKYSFENIYSITIKGEEFIVQENRPRLQPYIDKTVDLR